MLLAATLIGLLLYRHGLSSSSIMMVYLLSILLVSVTTSQRWYSGVSSVIILFLFNYFFVQPRFSLKVYESGYPVSFFVMFLTAMITGTLANRLKRNAQQSAETAFRTRIISETDQLLAKASTREEIMTICARQSSSLRGSRYCPFSRPSCFCWSRAFSSPGSVPARRICSRGKASCVSGCPGS